jgi:hypothetical protein
MLSLHAAGEVTTAAAGDTTTIAAAVVVVRFVSAARFIVAGSAAQLLPTFPAGVLYRRAAAEAQAGPLFVGMALAAAAVAHLLEGKRRPSAASKTNPTATGPAPAESTAAYPWFFVQFLVWRWKHISANSQLGLGHRQGQPQLPSDRPWRDAANETASHSSANEDTPQARHPPQQRMAIFVIA